MPKFPKKLILSAIFAAFAAASGSGFESGFGIAADSAFLVAAEPTVVASWEFDSPDDAKGWGRNHLAEPTVEKGVYRAQFVGIDPFVSSPPIELKPKPGQIIEIRMKSSGTGGGELFYASSNEGPYGGYSQQKTVPWEIRHDGEFRRYEIAPTWGAEPQIVKFRVDVGRPTQEQIDAGASVEIDYIRVLDYNVEKAAPLENAFWDAKELESLRIEAPVGRSAWRSELFQLDPTIAATASADAPVGGIFSFEWTDDGSVSSLTPYPKATLRLLQESEKGAFSIDLPIPGADSARSFCRNVDLALFNAWNGATIYRWELILPAGCNLKRLAFSATPLGPAAVDYQLVGSRRGIDRFDAETKSATVDYELLLRNDGGETLGDVDVSLENPTSNGAATRFKRIALSRTAVDPLFGTNPTGDRLAFVAPDDSQLDKTVKTFDASDVGTAEISGVPLAPGDALRVVATIQVDAQSADKPRTFERNLVLKTKTDERVVATIPLRFEVRPALDLAALFGDASPDCVPAPRPVESDYEIGAFYFPGWSRRSGWDKVAGTAPIRKPLLGWYDEANSEVVDWQIKWAVENGIQFFLVDWYWRNGTISLDHWIKAFQGAKYRKYLKWAVMWANHTGPGTHSSEDMRTVTKYWIDNYFNTPEYYRIDGKPVVMIWDRSVVDFDMIAEAKKEGVELKPGEGVKKALEISRQVCAEAGLPGIYFIAMKWPEGATDAKTVQKLADETFDGTSIYHFMDPGDGSKIEANAVGAPRDPKLYPFDDVVSASKPHWEALQKTGILPFLPNLATGWDSRPWHGFRQTVVYGRTVEKFRKLCADYKDFADESGVKRAVLAPLNEWGEGSYVEPNVEFGFGMYEALRETLCREPEGGFPPNYAPSEVGLGPYDLPEDAPKK